MNLSKFIFTIILLNVLSQNVHSQVNQDAIGLHPKTAEYALEVFGDVTQYQTTEFLVKYSERIRRVSIENLASDANQYPSLETVGLRAKYNPNLTVDNENFDPLNFNPLKYHFAFRKEEIQKFRVGNTGYVIVISPYKQ